MRRFTILLAVVVTAIFMSTGCTPAQVLAYLHATQTSSTCHSSVDSVFPPQARAWAHRVVNRESHGIATAQNKSSTAAGCFQLLRIHARRFTKLGYSWAHDRYRAWANTRVAFDLYREQGTRPWRLTT